MSSKIRILTAVVLLVLHVVANPSYATQGPGLPTKTFESSDEWTILSVFDSPDGHGNVAMVNGYLMVIYSGDKGKFEGNGGIEFWDISDPEEPERIYSYDNDETHGLREPHHFGFSSSYELDGSQADLMVAQGIEGIQFWDFTDPADIELLSYLDLPGITEGDYTGDWWVFWQAPYVYVAGTSAGLLIVDATDPENPDYIKTVSPNALAGLQPGVVFAVGNLLILAKNNEDDKSDGHFVTMDISDPENPILLDSLEGQPGYSSIFADGKIFVSGNKSPNGMHIYSVEHNGSIEFERSGTHASLGKGGYGNYQDGYFFSGFSDKFAKIHNSGALIGTASTGLRKRDEDFSTVLGNLVWIGDDHDKGTGLTLHDADPDTNPPVVKWMHPAPNSSNNSTLTRVGFSMSDNIDVESLDTETFAVRPLSGGDALEGHYSANFGIINFTPSEPLAAGTTYQVTIDGVQDWAGNEAEVFTRNFDTGLIQKPPLFKKLTENYDTEVITLIEGASVYTDRDYTFDDLPWYLDGQTAIITANDDKSVTDVNYIKFRVNQDSDIYILFDERATTLPAWLEDDYDEVGDTVTIEGDSDSPDRDIYRRYMQAQSYVPLAGPRHGDANGVQSNYTVVIVPRLATTADVNCSDLDNQYCIEWIAEGSSVYTDRDYTFGDLPTYLDGQLGIITANDDKTVTKAGYLKFELVHDSDIYILFDERATTLPAWLEDDYDEIDDTVTIDGDSADRTVYKRSMAAGSIRLPGPQAKHAAGVGSNYTVVIVERPAVEGLSDDYDTEAARIFEGSQVYTDRDYTFGSLPRYLDGQTAIITANDDKTVTDASYLEFELVGDSDIYILFDERGTTLPAWLEDDYDEIDDTVTIDGDSESTDRTVYKRVMAAGSVRLPGRASPRAGVGANYTVVIVPHRPYNVGTVQCTLNQDDLNPVEVGKSINFSPNVVNGGGIVSYSWSFGDDSQSTAFSTTSSASHTYSQPGRYFVELTVRNLIGSSICSGLQVVYRKQTTLPATRSASILSDGDDKVFNVNPDNDTVSAITHEEGETPSKLWEVQVGDKPTTLTLTTGSDSMDSELWVVNQGSSNIHILDPADGSRIEVIELRKGSHPFGIVASPDGQHIYVTTQGEGELYKYNVSDRTLAWRTIDQSTTNSYGIRIPTLPDARGIAVSADSSTIYVSRFRSTDMTTGTVYKVDASTGAASTISLAKDPGPDDEDSGRGVPTYLNSLTISPDGRTIKVPSVKANIERGMFMDESELTFETRVRTIVSTLTIDPDPDTDSATEEMLSKRIDLGDRDSATAVAFSPLGDYFAVVTQGNNLVELYDARTSGFLGQVTTGAAPRDVCINGTYLYVHNFLDRSVSVFDISGVSDATDNSPAFIAEVDVVSEETLSSDVLAGKQIFYRADARMSEDGYISCASCHLDGGHDGMVWDFTQVGEGLRNTIPLEGRAGLGHGNVHWTANFDEIQDFEHDIRNGFGGEGFLRDEQFAATSDPLGSVKSGGKSDELDQLADYVTSLDKVPDSPYRYSSGFNIFQHNFGKQIFDRFACAQCHAGSEYTDGERYDVGTIDASSGSGINVALNGIGFETPTLKGVWDTAPYFHNGRAGGLDDTLRIAQHGNSTNLNDTQIGGLIHFLLSLDDGPPIIDPTIDDFDKLTAATGTTERPHVSRLLLGGYAYADTTVIMLSIPSEFIGLTYLATYQGDRHTADDYLRFDVTSAVSGDAVLSTVYVGFDKRATTLPDWLTSWVDTGQELWMFTPSYQLEGFKVYKKDFPAGQITLGGNKQGDAAGMEYQYVVFVGARQDS